MAAIDIGGGSGKNPLFATTDSRYMGYIRQALAPQWQSAPDPVQAMLDRVQAAEAERLRKQAEEAARRAAEQNTMFGAPITADWLNSGINAVKGAAGAVGDWLTSPAPNLNITTDVNGNPLPDQGVPELPPMSMRIDVLGSEEGPEKKGYKQVPVVEQGEIRGYQYVRDQTQPLPTGTEATGQTMGGYQTGAEERPVPPSATQPYPETMYDGKTWKEAIAQAPEAYARVQEQAYGKPTMVEMANGDVVPMYDNKTVMYYGITADEQAQGFVAVHNPDRIGKGATPEEKMRFVVQADKAFIAPRYKIGDAYSHIRGLDRQGTIALQKQMKAAGFYDSNDIIIPGVLQTKDIEMLQDAMGFANKTGYTLNQALELRAKAVADARAQQKARSGGGGSGGTTRSVQIQYNQTSMAQGRAMLARILEDALGRPPSDSELAEYMARLNAAERKSPTKTVTNYVRGKGSTTSTSRTTPSKVDPESMAREFAAQIGGGDEMMAYKATSYLDKLMGSLMGAQNV
jgi:hypothetical protein